MFKLGQEVSVDIKSLYDANGGIRFGSIVPDFNENGDMEYFDLYNMDGTLACMDGETCVIIHIDDSTITLENIEDYPVLFTLTLDEAKMAL